MGLLNPGALYYLLALIPALALAYLVRERPRRVVVSSVLAFRALRARRGRRFGGWPRPDWMFFVEMLIIALAVLAIAKPYVTRTGNPIAVVLDDSAAMQATAGSGRSRFDMARAALTDALAREGPGEVNLYLSAPQPHRAGPPFASAAEASAALAQLHPADAPSDQAALTALLSELASDTRLRRVIYAGARPLAAPVPPRVEAFAAGDPLPNYAIGSFVLRRESLGQAALHARLTVANFSPAAQTLQLAITGDGKSVGHAQAHLEPGQIGAIEFPNLAPAGVYRADAYAGRRLCTRQCRVGHRRRGQINFDPVRDAELPPTPPASTVCREFRSASRRPRASRPTTSPPRTSQSSSTRCPRRCRRSTRCW